MSPLIAPAVVAHDCPDCLSETRLVHLEDNIHIAQVLHDETCPTYLRIQAKREARHE